MLLFRYFKVFKVHMADGYGITAQIHYELTVAQDAHDVAFLSFQHTGEYAQFDVVFGEFHKWVAQKGDTFGSSSMIFMKGRIWLSAIEAGRPVLQSFTK